MSFHFEPAPTIKIIEIYCEKDDQLKPKRKKTQTRRGDRLALQCGNIVLYVLFSFCVFFFFAAATVDGLVFVFDDLCYSSGCSDSFFCSNLKE